MARMVSPAGTMDVRISGITATKDELVMSGKFGAWESQIYLGRDEVVQTIKLMLNWPLIRFLLLLPVLILWPLLVSRIVRRSKEEPVEA